MKIEFPCATLTTTAALTLCLCIPFAGCSDSGSGIPYTELDAPQSTIANVWSPLPATSAAATSAERETGEKRAPLPEANSEKDSATEAPSDVEQIQQMSGNESTGVSSPIIPSVATTTSVPDQTSTSEPAVLTPDMTSQERINMLMNHPDLEESTEVLEVKLLIPEKRFRKEDGGKVIRVSYDDIDLLKILNMQPVPADAVDHFPNWLSDLEGQRIRIRGFMIPPYQSEGLKRFALARDNGICCFVRTPKIYDVINVRMAETQTTNYIANKPFDVEGIFHIEPYYEDGEWYALYEIEDATVSK